MSQSRSKEGDVGFFLPKKDFPTVSPALPEEYSSDTTKITKTVDLHIEDFLERLNDAVQRQAVDEDFITSPRIIMGHQIVYVSFFFDVNNDVYVYPNPNSYCSGTEPHPRAFKVTGNCGNLNFEEGNCAGAWNRLRMSLKLGSIEKMKEAMTTTGSNKLDLQVTLTRKTEADDSEWIIPR